MHTAPFRINFSDPTLLALDRLDELIDKPHLDVVTYNETTDESWIWMIITAPDKVPTTGGKTFFPAAHPMHLHGHDFALLRQSDKNFYNDSEIGHIGEGLNLTADKLNCDNPMLKCDNPPRRDVVLLPATGYVVIAFKADNPGRSAMLHRTPLSSHPAAWDAAELPFHRYMDYPLSHCIPRFIWPRYADCREQTAY